MELFEKAIKKVGLSAVEELLGKYIRSIEAAKAKSTSFKLALLISIVLELILICIDIYKAYKRKEAGEMSKPEYDEVVVKRVASGLYYVPISIICAIVGQVICPVPFVVAIICGIVGDFYGKMAVGSIYDYLIHIFPDSSPEMFA